jgi:hypothetical protein
MKLRLNRALLFLALLGVAGCDQPVDPNFEKGLWDALEIRDYTFVYSVSCFCGITSPNPARITVRNGRVTKVEPIDGVSVVQPGTTEPVWPTVDSLFAIIERARATNPAILAVEYDQEYHYPTSIHLDPVDRVADDEVTYRASQLIPSSSSQF